MTIDVDGARLLLWIAYCVGAYLIVKGVLIEFGR